MRFIKPASYADDSRRRHTKIRIGLLSRLKKQSDYYNFQQRTVGGFFRDAKKHGLRPTISERLEWGRMRMSPTDIQDVTGTYMYLVSGAPSETN